MTMVGLADRGGPSGASTEELRGCQFVGYHVMSRMCYHLVLGCTCDGLPGAEAQPNDYGSTRQRTASSVKPM
jgi:hypothetical protein